jgi:hypothetical protein
MLLSIITQSAEPLNEATCVTLTVGGRDALPVSLPFGTHKLEPSRA